MAKRNDRMNPWKKKALKIARARLGLGAGVKPADVIKAIRRRADAPPLKMQALLAWFCQQQRAGITATPPKRIGVVDEFLRSYEWRRLRMQVIKERGARCECCGATPADGVTVVNVDHIKPRKLYPELALDPNNLQVLCSVCNHGKGNWDRTDWRSRRSAQLPLPFECPVVKLPPATDAVVDREQRTYRRLFKFAPCASRDMRPRLVKRA